MPPIAQDAASLRVVRSGTLKHPAEYVADRRVELVVRARRGQVLFKIAVLLDYLPHLGPDSSTLGAVSLVLPVRFRPSLAATPQPGGKTRMNLDDRWARRPRR